MDLISSGDDQQVQMFTREYTAECVGSLLTERCKQQTAFRRAKEHIISHSCNMQHHDQALQFTQRIQFL